MIQKLEKLVDLAIAWFERQDVTSAARAAMTETAPTTEPTPDAAAATVTKTRKRRETKESTTTTTQQNGVVELSPAAAEAKANEMATAHIKRFPTQDEGVAATRRLLGEFNDPSGKPISRLRDLSHEQRLAFVARIEGLLKAPAAAPEEGEPALV